MADQPNKKKDNWEATRRRIKAQNDEIGQLKTSLERLSVTNKHLTKLLNKANGRVKGLEKDLNNAKNKEQEMEAENSTLKQEKKCLQTKIDQKEAPSQERIKKLQDKIKELNADLRVMQDEYVKNESRHIGKYQDKRYRTNHDQKESNNSTWNRDRRNHYSSRWSYRGKSNNNNNTNSRRHDRSERDIVRRDRNRRCTLENPRNTAKATSNSNRYNRSPERYHQGRDHKNQSNRDADDRYRSKDNSNWDMRRHRIYQMRNDKEDIYSGRLSHRDRRRDDGPTGENRYNGRSSHRDRDQMQDDRPNRT